jgi:hypothetical protein
MIRSQIAGVPWNIAGLWLRLVSVMHNDRERRPPRWFTLRRAQARGHGAGQTLVMILSYLPGV